MSGLYFKSIEVEQFRQFRDRLVIGDLDNGLNVIAGDNEAGKSTLLQAIRAALFDRHGGSVGETYVPYNASVSPKVGLVFELAGVEYRLDKVFSRKKEGGTILASGDGKRWEGQAAEERLADMLGFSYAKKGRSRREHQGLAGLLWVEQASAWEPVTLSDQSRQQIHAVFEHEMRNLLGGGHGEALHQRITELHAEYFDKRGKPKGEYRKLQEQIDALQRQVEAKKAELQTYEDKVDRVERLQAEQKALDDERALDKARERLRVCKTAMEEIAKLKAGVETGKERLLRASADRDRVRAAWETRTRLVEELASARDRAARLTEAVEAREAELVPQTERLEAMQGEYEELKARRQVLDAEQRQAAQVEEFTRLSGECERLQKTLSEARQADAERRHCLSERDAIGMTDGILGRLRDIERERDLARERLHAVATRLEHRLEPGVELRLGEEILSGEGEVRLTRRTELQIRGAGRIAIVPGGEDLQALQRRLDDQNHRLQQLLAEAGATSVAGAEELLRRAASLEHQAKLQETTLRNLAPEGLQALEDRYESAVARRDSLQLSIGDVDAGTRPASDLEAERRSLEEHIARLEGQLAAGEKEAGRLQQMLLEAGAEAREAERTAAVLEERLVQDRKAIADSDLERALTEAERTLDEVRRSNEAMARSLEAANPEVAEAELERAERVLDDLGREALELQRNIRDLEIELGALGRNGLAEELELLEAEHEDVRLKLGQLDRRARALGLLLRTLDDSLNEARESVARPIIDSIVPYLKQLIPDAEPVIDEDLGLVGIHRAGTLEAFDDLSIGTREQLAVLIRLAYADLLTAKGIPAMVILDDALVNSDDERRDRMKAILYQASRRYQILLLTCHGREYRDVGGKFARLDGLRG